jgi:hypothetical protein
LRCCRHWKHEVVGGAEMKIHRLHVQQDDEEQQRYHLKIRLGARDELKHRNKCNKIKGFSTFI